MRFIYVLFLQLSLFSSTLLAQQYAPSAQRFSNETVEQAYLRNLTFYLNSNLALDVDQALPPKTAYSSQEDLADLSLTKVPELASQEELMQEFVYIRDSKFITAEVLSFPRRLSWLYPDDGCFVRADLAARFAQEAKYKKPAKLFAFGSLEVETRNSPSGSVSWWYHVVIAYKVKGELYVIDPAIEPERPLTAKEWGDHMGGADRIRFSLCNGDTYQPYGDCQAPQAMQKASLIDTQLNYLNAEWYRVLELGRNASEELGDNPPWKKK